MGIRIDKWTRRHKATPDMVMVAILAFWDVESLLLDLCGILDVIHNVLT